MPNFTQSRSNGKPIIWLTLGFLALCSAVPFYWCLSPVDSSQDKTATVVLLKGKQVPEIFRELQTRGLIQDTRPFMVLSRVWRLGGKIRVGEYQLSTKQNPLQWFQILSSGVSIKHPVVIPEGSNIYEVAIKLSDAGLVDKEAFLKRSKDIELAKSLAQDPDAKSLEGYLFPDTYYFTRFQSTDDILKAMVRRFSEKVNSELRKKAETLHFTLHQWVTLASIVEKETGLAKDRTKISSVFHNRLRKKMRLESDPTTIYGMWDRFAGKIHKSDLKAPSDYNTYTLPGLPIGPICNPGVAALEAVLNPAPTEYLYFVSRNDGTTEFSKTYSEHLRAVAKFQLDPKAREGKSWRDSIQANGSHTPPSHQ